ncbi:hypothetical protein PG997_005391 [Apiospora hydei]|uniref:Uncharacterized protein n=1 Tax=Apiospora hydei TaxID=1337664 RepID=A0ABR1X4V0_9PEZI
MLRMLPHAPPPTEMQDQSSSPRPSPSPQHPHHDRDPGLQPVADRRLGGRATTTAPSSAHDGLSQDAFGGIIGGVVAFVAILLVFLICCGRSRGSRSSRSGGSSSRSFGSSYYGSGSSSGEGGRPGESIVDGREVVEDIANGPSLEEGADPVCRHRQQDRGLFRENGRRASASAAGGDAGWASWGRVSVREAEWWWRAVADAWAASWSRGRAAAAYGMKAWGMK